MINNWQRVSLLSLGIFTGTMRSLMTCEFIVIKVSDRWVPRMLTDVQKAGLHTCSNITPSPGCHTKLRHWTALTVNTLRICLIWPPASPKSFIDWSNHERCKFTDDVKWLAEASRWTVLLHSIWALEKRWTKLTATAGETTTTTRKWRVSESDKIWRADLLVKCVRQGMDFRTSHTECVGIEILYQFHFQIH